ncbi:AMP-dependent synthetase/ligase [Profundibacter sp.]
MKNNHDTIPRLLMRNATEHGADIAMREKDRGIWMEVTWAEYAEMILHCAAGLEALGVVTGEAVMILGDNRVRLYAGMTSLTMLNAFAMPAYSGATLEELQHYSGEVTVRAAIVEDQEQVDNIIELRESGADIPYIIYDEERGMNDYDVPGLMSWDDLQQKGRDNLAANPDLRTKLIEDAKPEDPAVFLHSSGTTGKPKGIILSQGNMISGAHNGFAGGTYDYGDDMIAYLPMAWAGDYSLTVAAAISYRFTVSVPERQETIQRDMREIAPSFYLAAPRTWDNMLTNIQVGIENSTPLKKKLYHFFMDRSTKSQQRILAGEINKSDWLSRTFGEWLIFGPVKDQFGMSRVKHAFTGGESIGEDTFVFYRALGIQLRQLYGQTETCAFSAIQTAEEVKLHTVGKPLPGVDVKIAEDGEILLKSDSVFKGYYGNPKATEEAFEGDFLRTGDAGYLEDDGHLVVLGRVSEVVHTASGERYVPNYVENRLKFSPYIKDAAVVGAGRDQLTAMVCVDSEAVGHWAEVNGVPYVSYADLSQRPEVSELLNEAFKRVNKALTDGLQLHRYVSLHKEFDPDDGEITRTRKLRRKVVEERYAAVVTALYDGSKDVHVQAVVTYETGEKGTVDRTLLVREV